MSVGVSVSKFVIVIFPFHNAKFDQFTCFMYCHFLTWWGGKSETERLLALWNNGGNKLRGLGQSLQNKLSFCRAVFEPVCFSGRMFDENGNMNDWWSAQSTDAFMEHSQCMVDQYSQFSLDGKHVSDRQSRACCVLCGCVLCIYCWCKM